jgi:hypothetical protein
MAPDSDDEELRRLVAEGIPQSAVVDQIFRAYFQGQSDAP